MRVQLFFLACVKVCKTMRYALLSLALLLSSSVLLSAQEPAATAPPLRVQSQLVVLDTVVTDHNGKVVTGLKKDDFTVYENGVPQTISHFATSEEQAPVPAVATKDRNGHDDWGAAPLTILVVDEMDTPFTELAYARDCTRNYLKAQPAQLLTPTILLWLNDDGLRALTGFTRDRQAILAALGKQPPSLPSKLTRGAAAEQVAAAFAALQQAALFSRGEVGKKELVWVGRSFPSIDPISLDDYSRTLLSKAVRSTADLLLASRVTLYVIDPTVTGSARDDDDQVQEVDTLQLETASNVKDPFASSFNLNLFVNETGGRYFRGRNDLSQQIADAEHRALTYYTLSYVPSEMIQPGAYRKITVRLRQPGLIAQTKKGYYSEPPPPAPTKLEAKMDASDLRFDLYEASVTGMQYTGLGVHIDRCTRDAVRASSTCTVLVDTGALSFREDEHGDQRTTLLTVLASLDRKGKLVNDTVSRLTLAIPQQQAAAIATGSSRLQLHTVVPAGTASLRLVVRDASGRIGTADLPPGALTSLVATDLTPKALHKR